jgi:hypothetical protein
MSAATPTILAVRCPVLARLAADGHPTDPTLRADDQRLERYCPLLHNRQPCCPTGTIVPRVMRIATAEQQSLL